MSLLKRPLGTSGLQITQVGLGAWAIGGGGWVYGWGTQDDADSVAAMRKALTMPDAHEILREGSALLSQWLGLPPGRQLATGS